MLAQRLARSSAASATASCGVVLILFLRGASGIALSTQRMAESPQNQTQEHDRDLVFMHVPFNFGHTVESVALFDEEVNGMPRALLSAEMIADIIVDRPEQVEEQAAQRLLNNAKPTAEVWGHANPDLRQISNITGCPMYFTPQKYWPEDLAERYFGSKTVFGLLRDPYERLVANFRGHQDSYGGADFSDEDIEACDANHALKTLMRRVLNDTSHGRPFAHGCNYIPQADYFEGKYGVTLPVNNRAFPASMNTVFAQHGYNEDTVLPDDIFHVEDCPNTWAGDLDIETKALIRQVYRRDFDLLCAYFDYCDDHADTCIVGVEGMCPSYVLEKNLVSLTPTSQDYARKQDFMNATGKW